MGWKEEFRAEKAKYEEKERLKQEKKQGRASMSPKDKAVYDMVSAGKWYAVLRWGIPGLLIVGFILLVIVTIILNQFGIYLR